MNIFLIVAIAVYVLWALVPGYLAHKKGRCGWAYAVLAIVITPLISSILVLARKDAPLARLLEETDEPSGEEAPVGEEAEAPAEEPKSRSLYPVGILANVVLAVAVGVLLYFGLSGCCDDTLEATAASYGENAVTDFTDYAILDVTAGDKTMNTVVAVDKDGNPAMRNSDMQICYWVEFYNFIQSYGSYASYFGLDLSTPLNEQASLDSTMNWEQYFLTSAINSQSQNYSLAQAAYASGYVPSEEDQESIDDILDPEGNLAQNAIADGYETSEAYIQANFGPGVSLEDYQAYVKIYLAAYHQYLTITEEEEAAATDDVVKAYYEEHRAEMEASRIYDVNNVSVRHILIQPEGDVDSTTNTYTDEAWAAAEEQANALLALWEEDPTEDNFAALANEHSADGGSNTNGGLYENFDSDDMVEEFSDWCFDTTREYGDTGIVKTSYGYHIMYFVEQTDTQGWIETVREQIINTNLNDRVTALCEEYPLKVDYSKVRILDMVTYTMNQTTTEETGSDD